MYKLAQTDISVSTDPYTLRTIVTVTLANSVANDVLLTQADIEAYIAGAGLDPKQGNTFVKFVPPDDPDFKVAGLRLNAVLNVIFEDVKFTLSDLTPSKHFPNVVQVTKSTNVEFHGSEFIVGTVTGSVPKTSSTDYEFFNDGDAAGFGLWAGGMTNLVVKDSVFTGLHKGARISGSSDITVDHNEFTGLSGDGLFFAGVDTVTINNNYFHDFERQVSSSSHSDMIQFSPDGDAFSQNVTISNNIFDSGSSNIPDSGGQPEQVQLSEIATTEWQQKTGLTYEVLATKGLTQSTIVSAVRKDTHTIKIDMNGASDSAGKHRDFTITNNIIKNSHKNALILGDMTDEAGTIEVYNNTLLDNMETQLSADDRKIKEFYSTNPVTQSEFWVQVTVLDTDLSVFDFVGNKIPDRGGDNIKLNNLPVTDQNVLNGFTFLTAGQVTVAENNLNAAVGVFKNDLTENMLDGTNGDDNLPGSLGDDVINGFSGNDTILGGDGNEGLDGGGGNDSIHGGDGNDGLNGGGGDDSLSGGDGDDVLDGWTGDDVLDGGAGVDTADYSAFGSGLTVNLLNTGAQFVSVQAGTDTLTNFENLIGGLGGDNMTGTNGDNIIDGNIGNDFLYGQRGNDLIFGGAGFDQLRGNKDMDTLDGGAGRDVLVGGSEADTFRFSHISDTGVGGFRDRIVDFSQGEDIIDICTIDAESGGTDQAFTFIGTSTFGTAEKGALRYFFQGSKTIIEGNVDGDNVRDFQIEMIGNIALTAGDFVL